MKTCNFSTSITEEIAPNKWWESVTKNYQIRELHLDDLEKISKLIESKPFFWKTSTIDSNTLQNYIDIYRKKLSDTTNRWKCVGAFLDNELVMETSAFFPLKANHWYHTSLRHISTNTSLGSGNLQRYLFADCLLPLINYGEKIEKFSFYTMRSAKHQKIINKMWDKSKPESPLSRYDYYIDGYVSANTMNTNYIYNMFFPNDITYDVDVVIYLHCLKQQYRVSLLKEHVNF
jgi:hypothetical protein